MKNTFYGIFDTPFGLVKIISDGEAITSLKRVIVESEPLRPLSMTDAKGKENPNDLVHKAKKQLDEYFAGKRRVFDIPLRPNGTVFQQSVWNALEEIPYGETRSYKQVAEMIGNPKACRAVGMANNKNPIWIMIPCHRVIGADGSLTGYGGGLDMKKRLLELERK